jgi:2-polyprenyl-3-methyl-5-hydroxy-6-metoxy-1,4-benzoquinol methylase
MEIPDNIAHSGSKGGVKYKDILTLAKRYVPRPVKNLVTPVYRPIAERYYQPKPDKKLLQEIMEYLNLSKSEANSLFKLALKLNAMLWTALDPQTEEQIKKFYEITPFYICELAYWHLSRGQRKLRDSIVEIASGDVLDYGGGIGDLSARLAEKGLNVTYADIQGKTFKFAEWLFKRRGLSVKVVDLEKHVLSEQYDTIICIDVIEHIPNPKTVLERMAISLKKQGRLIITNLQCSGDTEVHPMHFKAEFNTEKFLESLGLVKTGKKWLWVKAAARMPVEYNLKT